MTGILKFILFMLEFFSYEMEWQLCRAFKILYFVRLFLFILVLIALWINLDGMRILLTLNATEEYFTRREASAEHDRQREKEIQMTSEIDKLRKTSENALSQFQEMRTQLTIIQEKIDVGGKIVGALGLVLIAQLAAYLFNARLKREIERYATKKRSV